MPSFNQLALLGGLSLVNSMPSISRRQNPTQSITACIDSSCSNCPVTYKTGTGYPECNVYNTADLRNQGFSVSDDGLATVYFNVPTLDAGCKVIIQTPVTQNTEACGGNVLVAQSATCAPVQLDSTLIIQFCCGTGDCGAAGAPGKRDTSANQAGQFGGGLQSMFMVRDDGSTVKPRALAEYEAEQKSKRDASGLAKLMKRDCGTWTTTNGPYTRAGPNVAISNQVTCGPTESCMATEEKSVTQTFSVDVSVSVSDPFGIVSASVDVGWSKSIERSFSATYTFGPGETGYVDFVPILTCVDGYFSGDCDSDGVATTACGPTQTNGEMTGNIRGVIVR